MGTLKEFSERPSASKENRNKVLGAIADLLSNSGIDVDDVGRIDKVTLGTYQALTKDDAGEAHVHDLERSGIVFSPKWEDGPEWPVVAPAPPVTVRAPKLPGKAQRPFKRAVTLPDMQVGYYEDAHGNLHPTHDEAAIDLALQFIRFVGPVDLVAMHGDNADFPELSKYRHSPRFQRTTQATINRLGLFAAQVRASAGDEAVLIWLEGNHEFRLSAYIMDNAMAAFGLRRAGDPPGSWPVLSVPNLCNLDQHGITYLPGYPANKYWINDHLQVIHGNLVASNGSTAHKYLARERHSTTYGHVHRREWAERTRDTQNGPRTILAMSPGCLCRCDGKVPSTKGGLDLDGVPIGQGCEDWQQGVAVWDYEDGDGRFVPQQISLVNGWSYYDGRHFSATVDVEGNPV